MLNFSTPQQFVSPHLAGAEFGTSIGGNPATGASPDGLPEQKIFPGIVHETVRRGSMLAQAASHD
jgi:AMP deaminase